MVKLPETKMDLRIEIPDSVSIISTASSVRPVPSYQMTQATLRDIRFREISNEDLLFWTLYLKERLTVFSGLPLKRIQRNASVYFLIDWARLGLQRFEEGPANEIEDWFEIQVLQRHSYWTHASSMRFRRLSESMQESLTLALAPDLRVIAAIRQVQRDILSLIDHNELLQIALWEPFSLTQSPL